MLYLVTAKIGNLAKWKRPAHSNELTSARGAEAHRSARRKSYADRTRIQSKFLRYASQGANGQKVVTFGSNANSAEVTGAGSMARSVSTVAALWDEDKTESLPKQANVVVLDKEYASLVPLLDKLSKLSARDMRIVEGMVQLMHAKGGGQQLYWTTSPSLMIYAPEFLRNSTPSPYHRHNRITAPPTTRHRNAGTSPTEYPSNRACKRMASSEAGKSEREILRPVPNRRRILNRFKKRRYRLYRT